MNNDDFKNLENVFLLAKRSVLNDDEQLLNVIHFKAQLFERLKLAFAENTQEGTRKEEPLLEVVKKEEVL